jgi:hypothetical protein
MGRVRTTWSESMGLAARVATVDVVCAPDLEIRYTAPRAPLLHVALN